MKHCDTLTCNICIRVLCVLAYIWSLFAFLPLMYGDAKESKVLVFANNNNETLLVFT